MTTYILSMPSGFVRAKQATLPVADRLGPVQHVLVTVSGAWEAVTGAVHAVADELHRHRERRRMMADLTGLSAHTLKDIGLHRSGLRRAVLEVEQGADPRGR